jgi:hypothetical protein
MQHPLNSVATGSNRLNATDQIIGSPINRTSQKITGVLPAGGVMPINVPGKTFYLSYASNPLLIRPYPGGSFNSYDVGTGIKLEHGFTRLDIQNPLVIPVLFQVFIGFDEFIDNRVILAQSQFPLVAYPTYPTANAAATITITDRSKQAFNDINGNSWYAVSREAIYLYNIDAGTTYLLQKAGANTSSGPAIGAVYPTTSLRKAVSGNYVIATGGGNINMIVSELYYSIAA